MSHDNVMVMMMMKKKNEMAPTRGAIYGITHSMVISSTRLL